MSVNWSHLPREIWSKVCFCKGGKSRSFKYDPATGYWVHSDCGLPTPLVAIKECDLCYVTFVPRFYIKCQLDFMGVMCDTCDPPNEAKELERLNPHKT